MKFEWDETKNKTNYKKHGIWFEDAIEIFSNKYFRAIVDRQDYGEQREISIGLMYDVIIVVVHTQRNNRTRIISERPANKKKGKYIMKMPKKNLDMLKNIKDEDIDCSEIPPLDDDFWTNAKLVIPERKKSISLRLDKDILDYFKAGGRGYQTRINSVLKTYVRSVKERKSKRRSKQTM